MVQLFKVVVSEKASGEILETQVVPLNVAMAILGGYEKDNFYKAEAQFFGMGE